MVNGVSNTAGISSYPQSFQDLIQKPQNSSPQGAQPTAQDGDKVTISKKSKAKKVAAGIGIAAAAVLTLSTIAHKVQPKFFTDLIDKGGFFGTIAKGVDSVGKFISDIPQNISSFFKKHGDEVEDEFDEFSDEFDDLGESIGEAFTDTLGSTVKP